MRLAYDITSRLFFSLGIVVLGAGVVEQTHRSTGVSDGKMVWITGAVGLIGLVVWLVAVFREKGLAAESRAAVVEGADYRPEGPLTFTRRPQYWGGILCVIGLVLAVFSAYEVVRARPRLAIPRPVERPVVRFPELAVHGLAYRGSNSSAVINGRVVRVGEWVEGVQVVAIDRDSVWVTLDGQTNRLRLAP